MELIEVDSIQEGVLLALKNNPRLTKYRLSSDLGLSTSSHLNNYITGATKKARPGIMKLLADKYGIIVFSYKKEYIRLKESEAKAKEVIHRVGEINV